MCHRCSNPLHEGETFCSHCGAPQLVVEPAEPVSAQAPQQRLGGDPSRIQWRIGITSALLLAIPVGLLSALSGGMSTLLVIAGGFGTIFLYRRRTDGLTDGRMGWRLGAILGMAAAVIATAADAVQLLVERYVLHHAAVIDAQFQSVAQQMADQALKTNTEAMQQAPQLVHAWAGFWLSGDGHAAIQLLTAAIVSMGMVLFAATGGAIAGRVFAPRPGTQRTM
ncbi:MAG TPA: zinc ribbon domain-containing protein [Acidobacteriaceae bacterium]|nr:zinc ribbon domain-containing protein [Acidobacteriaceae bacterium]